MKTSPYELVFGQPPRQCIFPGANKTQILEEDIEDLINDDSSSQCIKPEEEGLLNVLCKLFVLYFRTF